MTFVPFADLRFLGWGFFGLHGIYCDFIWYVTSQECRCFMEDQVFTATEVKITPTSSPRPELLTFQGKTNFRYEQDMMGTEENKSDKSTEKPSF